MPKPKVGELTDSHIDLWSALNNLIGEKSGPARSFAMQFVKKDKEGGSFSLSTFAKKLPRDQAILLTDILTLMHQIMQQRAKIAAAPLHQKKNEESLAAQAEEELIRKLRALHQSRYKHSATRAKASKGGYLLSVMFMLGLGLMNLFAARPEVINALATGFGGGAGQPGTHIAHSISTDPFGHAATSILGAVLLLVLAAAFCAIFETVHHKNLTGTSNLAEAVVDSANMGAFLESSVTGSRSDIFEKINKPFSKEELHDQSRSDREAEMEHDPDEDEPVKLLQGWPHPLE